MNEADRAAYTDKALHLWSTWTGVDVTTLRDEAEGWRHDRSVMARPAPVT